MEDRPVNSKGYWNDRFGTDWEEKGGRDQTVFFCELAIRNIPEWIIKDIKENAMSIFDWGCAEGDCVNLLAMHFPRSSVTGIDISEEAIRKAKERFPANEFIAGEMEDIGRQSDVMFSSNTLEHFDNPKPLIEMLLSHAGKYLMLLLPFQEKDRIEEHLYTFDYDDFPVRRRNFNLSFYKEIDCKGLFKTKWAGKQLLIIYVSESHISPENINISSFSEPLIDAVNKATAERDEAVVEKNFIKSERDLLSRRLEQTAYEKDRAVMRLNAVQGSISWRIASFFSGMPLIRYPYLFLSALRKDGLRAALKKFKEDIFWKKGKAAKVETDYRQYRMLPPLFGGGMKGKVSIVIPVYNQARFLKEAIDGALNQTYSNIELIVVNDGSTDNVEAVLNEYIEDPRVIILTEENRRLPAALNGGFKFATGEFYTWTSADNIMLPNQVEELVRFLGENPDADMVYSDYRAIDEAGMPISDPSFRPHNRDMKDASIIRLPAEVTEQNLHDSGDNFIGASFMYRSYAARILGDYSEDSFGGEDYDYWLRMNGTFRIKHLGKALYKYRVHEGTLNAKARELNLFDNIKRVLERDKKRRESHKEKLNVLRIGFNKGNADLGLGDTLLIFKYSRRKDREVMSSINREDAVSFCVVDEPLDEYASEDETLKKCDYAIAADAESFDICHSAFRDKSLHISDVEGAFGFIEKAARYRLFEKRFAPESTKALPSVYTEKRRLTVALQVDNFDRGGLEQVVYDLACGIDRGRFNPCVLVINKIGLMGDKLKSKGINVFEINNSTDAYADILKNLNVDILNVHYSRFGLELASEMGIGIIYTIHNSYTWLSTEKMEELLESRKFIDKYIAVSRRVRNYHRRKFGIESHKIDVIPNGLNPKEMEEASGKIARGSLGFGGQDFIFLSVASFNGVKAHHHMISAMREVVKKHPDIKLLFIGNALNEDYYEEIKGRIIAEGLNDNIKVMDYMSRADISDIYKCADCFLLPSIQEGWSISAMEAMYFGLPIIMTETGSSRDIIRAGDIGIVIKPPYKDIIDVTPKELTRLSHLKSPDNLEELKGAMLEIYENRDYWKKKAEKGRERVINEFYVEKMTELYEKQFMDTYYIERKRNLKERPAGTAKTNNNPAAGMKAWEEAQKAERDFWIHVSEKGYEGHSPRDFHSSFQRQTMLRAIPLLGEKEDFWLDKVVIEVGSGPSGIVEHMRAGKKYAVEPLIESYRKHYPHLNDSDVMYLERAAEDGIPLPDGAADLVICYNMLDHSLSPEKVMAELGRVAKKGGHLLFQVNIYDDATLKRGMHKVLHPHTFTEETALEILKKNRFDVYKKMRSGEPNEEGEFYFIAAARKL